MQARAWAGSAQIVEGMGQPWSQRGHGGALAGAEVELGPESSWAGVPEGSSGGESNPGSAGAEDEAGF